MDESLTIELHNRASICADSLPSKNVQKQPAHGKIDEPAKQWNAMQALTNQTVKESFHG